MQYSHCDWRVSSYASVQPLTLNNYSMVTLTSNYYLFILVLIILSNYKKEWQYGKPCPQGAHSLRGNKL